MQTGLRAIPSNPHKNQMKKQLSATQLSVSYNASELPTTRAKHRFGLRTALIESSGFLCSTQL
jgi:hypothetical protein